MWFFFKWNISAFRWFMGVFWKVTRPTYRKFHCGLLTQIRACISISHLWAGTKHQSIRWMLLVWKVFPLWLISNWYSLQYSVEVTPPTAPTLLCMCPCFKTPCLVSEHSRFKNTVPQLSWKSAPHPEERLSVILNTVLAHSVFKY